MCGIGGILRVWPAGATPPPPHESIPESWLDTIDAAIKHRGPDGHGRFRDRATRADGSTVDVALVHRRLAIIDPACGQQPMVSERGRNDSEGLVAVVFNGCIYNHRELRRELEAAGHRFRTDHSDTEVLIHGWREWKEKLADRLDGMYAFALWDRASATLHLSRDLAHEKPLYAVRELSQAHSGASAFASVPAALAELLRCTAGIVSATSEDWVSEWVRFGASDEDAIAGVRAWRARAMVHPVEVLGDNEWRFAPLPSRDNPERLDEARAEQLIKRSVEDRLVADVELGCLLSGGVDSSLVAHFAQKATGNLRTFTVRMPDPAYDESPHAERVARHLGTRHTTLECDPNPAADLVRLIEQIGIPFGDSSLLPTYWVCKAARTAVKVALSGDGGDELFCGYERHLAALKLRPWARLLGRVPPSLIPDRDPKSSLSKLRRAVIACRYGYRELLAVFQLPDLVRLVPSGPNWVREGVLDEPDPAGLDFWEYLANDLMVKADTASMSVGLELRSAMLSRDLITACLRAPYNDLLLNGERKGLLRAIARKHVPPEIVDRPKQGFAIPIGEWFRNDYGGMKQLLMDHLSSADPWPNAGLDIDRGFVTVMLDEHMHRHRDHSHRLYVLLVLSIWARSLRLQPW